jgi:hypothetical protein
MGNAQRHHLVSQGYLRAWADPGGRRVALLDKANLTARPVGVADVFVARNLLTFKTPAGPSDALEAAFGKDESEILPHVRRYIAGDRDVMATSRVAALAALHWGRSYSFPEVHDRVTDEAATELADISEIDVRLAEAFERDYGRPAAPGERRARVLDFAQDFRKANVFFAQRVQHHYHEALKLFSDLHVQAIGTAVPTSWSSWSPTRLWSSWVASAGSGALHPTPARCTRRPRSGSRWPPSWASASPARNTVIARSTLPTPRFSTACRGATQPLVS